MFQITDEIVKAIENRVKNGERSREAIFYGIISNDEELERITKLYRERKSVDDITIEEKIPIERVRKNIDVIEQLNKIIDQKIYKAHNLKHYEKRVIQEDMPHSNQEELNESISAIRRSERLKRESARKKLTRIISEYMIIKRDKKSDIKYTKKFVKENINEFIELNNLLGYNNSKLLHLANMYNDLGDFKRANNTLSRINKSNMSDIEERNFEIARNKAIRLENANFIKALYQKGLNDDEIFEQCEKVSSERRVQFLNRDFVNKVIRVCKKRERLAKQENNEFDLDR